MRILGGRWRGALLISPGAPVRPSREDLRAELFLMFSNRLPDLEEASVLDLFAGTGSLGLEALSRGAKSCDFIENGPAALHALKANIAARRIPPLKRGVQPSKAHPAARLFKRDAIPFAAALQERSYDIAFADPPYRSLKLDRILEIWQQNHFAGCLLIEHPSELDLKGDRLLKIEDRAVTAFIL